MLRRWPSVTVEPPIPTLPVRVETPVTANVLDIVCAPVSASVPAVILTLLLPAVIASAYPVSPMLST